MRMPITGRLGAMALAFQLPLGSGSPAGATHAHETPASVGELNTSDWRVCLIADVGRDALETGVARADATVVSAVVANCAGSTNVTARADSYAETWFGATDCTGTVTDRKCTSMRVRPDLAAATTAQQRRKTSTHEFGHVGGLGHRFTGNGSCMVQGESPPIAETFDAHDKDALANTY